MAARSTSKSSTSASTSSPASSPDAEALLAQRQLVDELQALVNHMPDGVMVLGPGGVVRQINQEGCRQMKLARHLVLGRPLSSLLDFDTAVEQVFRTGQGYVDRELIINSPTLRLHVVDTAVPVKGPDGQVLSVVNTFREIGGVRRLADRMVGSPARYTFDSIIGQSPALLATLAAARKAARGKANILLCGESGTGKEVLAQAIHNHSARRSGPFVAINCAALPRELIESELFGYSAGSFTGARREGRPGKFESASGGTIFLDELGELPLDVQAKLLRVLQEREVVRLGDTRSIAVDVRIISASNRDLAALVGRREFREDLYYRCNVIELTLPPLRERTGDIALLAAHFLAHYAAALGKAVPRLSAKALQKLGRNDWPGNVRELENAVERMVNLCDVPEIDEAAVQLPLSRLQPVGEAVEAAAEGGNAYLRDIERAAIEQTLRRTGYNVTQTAGVLGISKPALYAKIKRYGVRLERGGAG